jgi:hypothetical protein
VRRQDDAAAVGGLGEDGPQRDPLLRVEPGGRLVEDEEVRGADERGRQRHALLHAARQRADALVHGVTEADGLEHRRCVPPPLGRVRVLLEDGDVVDHLEGREPAVEPWRLGEVAEPAAHLGACRRVGRVEAQQGQGAAVGSEHGGQDPQQRRLAGAVGAEHPHDASPEGQVDLVHGGLGAERLGDAGCAQQRARGRVGGGVGAAHAVLR